MKARASFYMQLRILLSKNNIPCNRDSQLTNYCKLHTSDLMLVIIKLSLVWSQWDPVRNSPIRRESTDLRQNAVFHNFSRQTAFIQCSGPSKHAYAFSKTSQKISKITYTASRFSLLTSAKFAVNIKRVTLQHNKEF